MVLESILNPKNAEDKPWHIFIIAFFYSIIAIFFSNQLFPEQSSILSVALITIIFVPFFQKLFVLEEEKEDLAAEGKIKQNIFSRHWKSISVFSTFFLGVVVAMSFIFIFFPSFDNVFALQQKWFEAQGLFPSVQAIAGNEQIGFEVFVFNNSQVMILMFVLSIIFGAGAIFILVWNASIIAVFSGLFVRSFSMQGLDASVAYLLGVPISLGSIALHGIPEIAAYFFAGLAGGILSVGIIRENFMSKEFMEIAKDAVIFLIIAEILIVLAAFLEAFV